jgi:hypothetical protein
MSHTIIIQGGLGNQLFQIFTLMNYCIKHDFTFVFPLNMQTWDKRQPYWDTFLYRLKDYTKPNDCIDSIEDYNESSFHYDEIPLFKTNCKLNGYFQTDLYFKEYYETICNIIGIQEKQDLIKRKYIQNENTISLHFRMGDYGHPLHHPIIPDTYYINCLHYIINKTNNENWNIYYACEKEDDAAVLIRINNIKNSLTSKGLHFIKISNDLEDWEQLLLMSVCQHNIVANSTFSWWSAYLNKTNEKIVCYPEVWFGPAKHNHNLKDLHPNTWNKIHI